jgi:RNA polymerase sigma-70 factor (TIGR02960 family)
MHDRSNETTLLAKACLHLSSRRSSRILSMDYSPPFDDTRELGDWVSGPVWLEPLPDEQSDFAIEEDDPAARHQRRESVELAYMAALQHLPSNQRAVLILRDVLDFSAAETAGILETSATSVNSALQRARKNLKELLPATTQQRELGALGDEDQRRLVEAFVGAWERADLGALLELLAEDARFSMPPLPAWFNGRDNVARFFAERVFETPWRLQPRIAVDSPMTSPNTASDRTFSWRYWFSSSRRALRAAISSYARRFSMASATCSATPATSEVSSAAYRV